MSTAGAEDGLKGAQNNSNNHVRSSTEVKDSNVEKKMDCLVEEKDVQGEEGGGEEDDESSHCPGPNGAGGHAKRKNRRRGKGKTKKVQQQQQPLSTGTDHLRAEVARKVAEEQVQEVVRRGFLAACWSLGIVLPQHSSSTAAGETSSVKFSSPSPLVQSTPPEANYPVERDYLLFGRSGQLSGVLWEGTLMSIVDRAAHDPATMESLVEDLALALPEISMEIQHHHQNDVSSVWDPYGMDASSLSAMDDSTQLYAPMPTPPPGFALEPQDQSTSYIEMLLQVSTDCFQRWRRLEMKQRLTNCVFSPRTCPNTLQGLHYHHLIIPIKSIIIEHTAQKLGEAHLPSPR